ncbi:helix-turn-helix domain-containing protein [Sphingomonas sp.]|jgi:excisionase family DNA binding protein|uniref:helix-turn-helix domain-containing protein n=1 Tax=Sphingomonas sp. TaxID=28214 RepID=UPI0026343A5B|nr:helix-turn-helix domain-containing protein [Sphingomonas sp.]MDK2768016.1 helix-turn-helix domain-containing protein [Sphingomonas sp.]
MRPITVSIADAVEISGLSQATLYRLIGRKELATVKVGRRRLVRLDSLEQLVGT